MFLDNYAVCGGVAQGASKAAMVTMVTNIMAALQGNPTVQGHAALITVYMFRDIYLNNHKWLFK